MAKNKDRENLKECLRLLVNLDCEMEAQCPEWYSRAQLIADLNDFYVEIESDNELGDIISNESDKLLKY